MTVGRIRNRSEHRFLVDLQADLRSGAYRPSPARRKLIPKAGKPGQFRPLGIPTIRDRVVQGAARILLEPIFEAQFWHVSYGFRPGRNTHGALEYIRRAALPQKWDKDTRRNRLPYPWVIEGDIKGCFDNINHHQLLERMRKRIGDRRVVRLVGLFLKAGVLTEDQFLRTDAGIPQGGIISPLLANIALARSSSDMKGGPITAKRPKPVAKATGWRQRRAPGTAVDLITEFSNRSSPNTCRSRTFR